MQIVTRAQFQNAIEAGIANLRCNHTLDIEALRKVGQEATESLVGAYDRVVDGKLLCCPIAAAHTQWETVSGDYHFILGYDGALRDMGVHSGVIQVSA